MLSNRFEQLSTREKKIFIMGFPFIIFLFSWLLLIEPIIKADEKLTRTIENKQQELDWMLANIDEAIIANGHTTYQNNNIINQSQLRQIVNKLLKRHSISIDRIQNNNKTNVSYQLNDSKFNNVLKLIKDCENHSIKIVQVQITKSQTLGLVNTRLVVSI